MALLIFLTVFWFRYPSLPFSLSPPLYVEVHIRRTFKNRVFLAARQFRLKRRVTTHGTGYPHQHLAHFLDLCWRIYFEFDPRLKATKGVKKISKVSLSLDLSSGGFPRNWMLILLLELNSATSALKTRWVGKSVKKELSFYLQRLPCE